MALSLRISATLLALGLLGACGSRALETPESLVVDEYAAGKGFEVVFVMKACSDTCSTYEAAECEVETDTEDGNVLRFSVSVPYSDKDGVDPTTLDGCSLTCGAPVRATCEVPGLDAGTWSVEAGTFRGSIEVR